MIHHKFAPLLMAAALAVLTLSSGGFAWAEPTSRVSTSSPRLPRGIVRVEGGQPVTVSIAGRATCRKTTPQEAATALAATNGMRAQRGLSPLKTDPKLQRAAEAHACEMAQRGVMTHAGASGSGPSARSKKMGYRPRITAENIAAGRFDMNRVHQEWARSPGHLSNIMIQQLQDHGIGLAVAADGKTVFWATVYGRKK